MSSGPFMTVHGQWQELCVFGVPTLGDSPLFTHRVIETGRASYQVIQLEAGEEVDKVLCKSAHPSGLYF